MTHLIRHFSQMYADKHTIEILECGGSFLFSTFHHHPPLPEGKNEKDDGKLFSETYFDISFMLYKICSKCNNPAMIQFKPCSSGLISAVYHPEHPVLRSPRTLCRVTFTPVSTGQGARARVGSHLRSWQQWDVLVEIKIQIAYKAGTGLPH